MWKDSTERSAPSAAVPACLCKQVMHRPASQPVMRRSSSSGEYIMFCPSCKIRTYPSMNKQSVIAEWCGINRPGDQHVEQLWLEKLIYQQNGMLSAVALA